MKHAVQSSLRTELHSGKFPFHIQTLDDIRKSGQIVEIPDRSLYLVHRADTTVELQQPIAGSLSRKNYVEMNDRGSVQLERLARTRHDH